MEYLAKEIRKEMFNVRIYIDKCLDGQKGAGRKARKASLNLEKLLKVFRKESIKNEKDSI